MMTSLAIGLKIAYAFVLHFVADWALQSKEMGRQKSNNFFVLLQHALQIRINSRKYRSKLLL